ncbi:hypothetical protein O6H91_18G032700 [Diphasiastrum complanatum]|uniref:Uncharacterized protein n=1 Tax=Diphasiastrum complanatum TaxID=34168 RepID=A0ACC2AZV2_DIPCM|nr:hypothetical protein O6H91_18G032700 [Diphasiastrum complanatum]
MMGHMDSGLGMDSTELQANLSLGCIPPPPAPPPVPVHHHGGGNSLHKSNSNSNSMQQNEGLISMSSDNSVLFSSAVHPNLFQERPIMGHSDASSPNPNNVVVQQQSVGNKHAFGLVANSQPPLKRRKEGGGSCLPAHTISESPFRSHSVPQHLQSQIFSPSLGAHHMVQQNFHQPLHNFPHSDQILQQNNAAFQNCSGLNHSKLQSENQALLIQRPTPSSIQALQSSLRSNGSNILPNLPEGSQQMIASPLQQIFLDTTQTRAAVGTWGNQHLSTVDPDLWDIMEKEKVRQWKGIELIASENYASLAVLEALGSHLTNKYSEGMPGARYYGGNEYIDQIETLCCDRALAAFHLDPDIWGVNVQPYSCTSANFAVYTALLQPKDRIMGLDSPSGGHLSHGYYTFSGKKVSAASIFFESLPYKVNPQTGYIDFEKLEERALDFRPKILICGGSAYPREWDYLRFRQIADKCGAVLMCDMAHISGLVAAKECLSPFEYCDVVTSTTHKGLRGPRGGMIFYRKGPKQQRKVCMNATEDAVSFDFEERISFAVFPSLQGGPHNNHIAALAVAFKQIATPEYKSYILQVKKNAQVLASALQRRGFKLVTGGTDNHLMLWDLRPVGLTGYLFEKVCELCHITLNKNAVFGDSRATAPGGVRIGTPAMTSRGCSEADFESIAEFLYKAVQIALTVQREPGKQCIKGLQNNKEITDLRNDVEKFASSFEMPGFDLASMKYNH